MTQWVGFLKILGIRGDEDHRHLTQRDKDTKNISQVHVNDDII